MAEARPPLGNGDLFITGAESVAHALDADIPMGRCAYPTTSAVSCWAGLRASSYPTGAHITIDGELTVSPLDRAVGLRQINGIARRLYI